MDGMDLAEVRRLLACARQLQWAKVGMSFGSYLLWPARLRRGVDRIKGLWAIGDELEMTWETFQANADQVWGLAE